MTKEDLKLLGEIAEKHHVLGELVPWEERAVRHPPQPSLSSPNKGTSVGGQLWEQGNRIIVGEPVTFALNARSWQSSRINEGMTPEQCHANHYHLQQVEGSAGWDRHSSGDLHNRQMDGQDKENGRIYNQGFFHEEEVDNLEEARNFYWWSIRRGEEEIILGRGLRTSLDLPPNHAVDDPIPWRSRLTVEGVLTKAQFSSPLLYQIHCIGPVGFGFGFAHIYSERSPPNWDPIIGVVCGKNLGASESDNRTGQGQTPKRERWWPTYWTANGELPRDSQLGGRLAPRAWPSPPLGAGRLANLAGGPR